MIVMDINKPSEVRDLIIQIIEDILENQKTIPQAGTISYILGVRLKAWELEKAIDLEARISALENTARSGFDESNKH
jgi:hypothetical protein